ncbi:hypothetical protein M422DRAFT_39088 [Sphaerobolus stellatus SS14]|uniref:Uncharacterized protein n=1 Tax=Sphaerobolus stellatus (strain SS14) TaxID=990650 RepID=A0A0C9UHB7_SPHS4|nr:hypothetical protein M422DRAFT_39088 [Sphaerobolus stellatus SS14]
MEAPKSLTEWLYRPWTQLLLISFICFCDPGMYNSISGIGGSGQLDPTVAANATVALLAATAVAAFTVVPTVFDVLGPRGCLLLSGWTYPLYAGSLLCYNHTQNSAFVIVSGAILGVGAAFLWTAQGDIMLSYPTEGQRGRAIAWFWVIFNIGGAVGGFMSFGLNFKSKAGTVSDSTYIAFIVVMAFGWLLSVFVAPPNRVTRSDGTVVARTKHRASDLTWKQQLRAFTKAYSNWRIMILIPMFFCTNIPYSYQQNSVNGATFTIRSRSLNSALYWLAQVFGGLFIGFVLDIPSLRRSNRAKVGWVITFVLTFAIYGGGFAFQKWTNQRPKNFLDFSNVSEFVGPCFLYIFYGMYDAIFQSLCYWTMGALSNNPHTIARYVALYKTFQAAGGAMAWRINALHKPAMTQFAMNWGLLAAALIIASPALWTIKDTTEPEDDEVLKDQKNRDGFESVSRRDDSLDVKEALHGES